MKKKIQSNCECCEFYEYDEECDAYGNCELCRATWLYDHGCRMEINEEGVAAEAEQMKI